MKINKGVLVVLSLTSLLLSGCMEDEPPKCSNDRVTNQIKIMYKEGVQENVKSSNSVYALFLANMPSNIVTMEFIHATGYDKNIKLRECKATANFDNNTSAPLLYTIQTNEKEDGYYIEINKESLQAIAQQSFMNIVTDVINKDLK